MAKRRRVNDPPESKSDNVSADKPRLQPLMIAVGILAGAVVYVSYHPSDSVSVEKGDALWFSAMGLVIAVVTCTHYLQRRTGEPTAVAAGPVALAAGPVALAAGAEAEDDEDAEIERPAARAVGSQWVTAILDIAPWLLGVWMMIAAVASCPPGNLRMATSEAWLWVAGAAVFTASRRLTPSISARRSLLILMVICASGSAVHGLHQQFISLEQTRQQYRRDPERVLRLTGIDAPAGSAQRMVFENRLFDGGPTGTFALANSLAAVLLVGVVVAFGVLRLHWRSMGTMHQVLWLILLLLCGGCLLATRSRSALLAAIIGIALTLLWSSRLRAASRRVVMGGMAAVVVTAVIGGIGLSAFGNPEWFEQAPASLSFRFQYWRSTLALAADSPVWGAGPGNFQSIYERYREPSAHEQIAEPHNFFFETLASGGVVAVGLMFVIAICGVIFIRSHSRRESDWQLQSDEADRWVWLGAGLGLILVWLLGFAAARTPDLDAHLFVVPTMVVAAVLLSPSLRLLSWCEIDSISIVTLASLLIHLSVAGGWTVPGVAICVWLLSAILTRVGPQAVVADGTFATRSRANFVTVIGMSALAAIWFASLRPVEIATRSMARAEYAQTRQRTTEVQDSLQQALQADPWSPAAAIWLADYDRWGLVMTGDSRSLRERWKSNLAEARRRAGDDPAIYRLIGKQQLHLYQRYGQREDLDASMKTFSTVAGWAPSDEATAAQLAVVAETLEQTAVAQRSAKRAEWLSRQGGNIERTLDRHQILVAQPIGSAATSGPVRQSARELLANQLDKVGVASQTE